MTVSITLTCEQVVHIIDDDSAMLDALSMQLRCAGFATETYSSGPTFLATYRPRDVECAIVDLRMPGLHGLELQQTLRERHLQMPIVFLSAFGRLPDVVRAMQNGANDFLEKPIDEGRLLAAVTQALARDSHRKQRNQNRDRALWSLTQREREVLDLLVAAKGTLSIAHLLGISPKTVEKHRVNIFNKTNVQSVPELINMLAANETTLATGGS